ncbi:hypothetical protein CSAL01_10181 [Colletotrichum salicis]|uniref:Uncharacterized protein n=1 Tax=Colletotrichum salicis TaxID=1209931 RepID=A0A135TLT3_9PEZI|nr:hypothetical protein CSAL01_10181 [Colletotrichum salicis]
MAVALENPRSPSTRLPSRPFLVRLQSRTGQTRSTRGTKYSRIGKHRESYLAQVYSTPETSNGARLRYKLRPPYLPIFRPAAAPFENARHDSLSDAPTSIHTNLFHLINPAAQPQAAVGCTTRCAPHSFHTTVMSIVHSRTNQGSKPDTHLCQNKYSPLLKRITPSSAKEAPPFVAGVSQQHSRRKTPELGSLEAPRAAPFFRIEDVGESTTPFTLDSRGAKAQARGYSGCETPRLTAEGIPGSSSAPLCTSPTPLITPHHFLTFPISKERAPGIVSLTGDANLRIEDRDARPRIVTHRRASAKHRFAAPSWFGSSTTPLVPDNASRTQSECRYPGYSGVSAHLLFLYALKRVVPPFRPPAASHPDLVPAGPDNA